MDERQPFDLKQSVASSTSGQCFICEYLNGNPRYAHVEVYRTDSAVAFLNRFPTLKGYVLVAPIRHVEQVTGDFDENEYVDIQRFIYHLSEAMRSVLQPERIYILSLGSQAANAHVHWHIAPLPAGVPLEQQQYHALMSENGTFEVTPDEQREYADKLAKAIRLRPER